MSVYFVFTIPFYNKTTKEMHEVAVMWRAGWALSEHIIHPGLKKNLQKKEQKKKRKIKEEIQVVEVIELSSNVS